MEQRIQQKAEELFFTYGLKSVSMDDIARAAGISKKTIYQSFNDKNAIVKAIVTKLVEQQQEELKQSLARSENAIHEIVLIAESVQALITKLKPVMLYDLNKYFPECWKLMKNFKEESLRTSLITNLKTGITQGFYRDDIDLAIISQFCLVQFSSFFDPDSYPNNKYKISTVLWQITQLVLCGISSPKGNLEIQKYFTTNNNENKS